MQFLSLSHDQQFTDLVFSIFTFILQQNCAKLLSHPFLLYTVLPRRQTFFLFLKWSCTIVLKAPGKFFFTLAAFPLIFNLVLLLDHFQRDYLKLFILLRMSHSTIKLTTPADIGKEPNLNCIFMDFVTYSLSEKHIICFARHE